MLTRRLLVLAAVAAATASTQSFAQTPDKLKVAISQRGFWDSSFLEFAQKEGFLKEANLDVEFFYTEGGGQTLQVINAGSVDVAMSNGFLGTIGAFSKGAPTSSTSATTRSRTGSTAPAVSSGHRTPCVRRRRRHLLQLSGGVVRRARRA